MRNIIFLFTLTLIPIFLLSGCNNQDNNEIEEFHQTIKMLEQEIQRLKNDTSSLHKELSKNKEEQTAFINANRYSKTFISAMIRGDAEVLNKMSSSNVEFYSHYYKKHLKDGRTGKIGLSEIQSKAIQEHNVTINVHGFAYTPSQKIITIVYAISPNNTTTFYIHLSLKQNEDNWIITDLNFGV